MDQLSLFDTPKPTTCAHLIALDDYALLYTATETGAHSGIRFAMTREDAKKWCSSKDSKGVLMGTEWAYFWTSIRNFLMRDSEYDEGMPPLDIRKLVDNGTWDERIASLGLRKIALAQFPQVFEPPGVHVIK